MINNELDTKLKAVLDAAINNPKKKNTLSKTIIENFDLIQHCIENGVTYTQIAAGLGINYSHFMTYLYRSRKKINRHAKPDNSKVKIHEERRQTPDDFSKQPDKAPLITLKKTSEQEILRTQPISQNLHDGIQKTLTPADLRKLASQEIDLSGYTNSNFKKGK
ncbi:MULTISPECIES: hypothetical protein [Methylobacter]